MKLHLDKDAFRVLIGQVSEKTGYRQDVLEKDYYVTMILQELAVFQQDGLPAYFKGGTALYKALKSVRRFSEDIDLSVDVRDCSRSQGDKRIDKATKKFTCLLRNPEEGYSNRSEVISYYIYMPIVDYDTNDILQRFGKVKIEATSFTISEPYEKLTVSPIIYDKAEPEQKLILKDNFGVFPFDILTMTMERIFVDKLFAAEAYTRNAEKEHRAFETSKHIYDLAVILDEPRIKALMENEEMMEQLLSIRLKEEQNRLDGVPGILPRDFIFFDEACNNSLIKKAYTTMQNQYVFMAKDRINIDNAAGKMIAIKNRLTKCRPWYFDNISDYFL
ncbi:MAG: nucleotidyl transferase AbiEii/AbiGii toxin family protein [Paludibacter sp.]|nr:nucleotidyl transferase AbiEii/AbiGii toxin family protein [Paludibacter sp.]